MDAVPAGISLNDVKESIAKIKGVQDFHHIHIWAISTTENALTGHLVIDSSVTAEEENSIKEKLRHELIHKNIRHITIETERTPFHCATDVCATQEDH